MPIKPMVLQFFRQQQQIYGNEYMFSDMELKRRLWNTQSSEALWSFREANQNCTRCNLHRSRKHVVFGEGNAKAELMLIGEAPGEQEDQQGRPFVGKAGQLLDKILKAIEFEREEIFIANILKCRPPNNRDPLPEEIEQCIPHLIKQIAMIQPGIILALGRIAAQTLLNTTQSLNQLREKKHEFQGIPLLVTFHPAALLRNPQWKRNTWEDVKRVRNLYDQLIGDKGKWTPAKRK
jgi:DNA polymerase